MLNNEICKKGTIVEYFPLRKTGSIAVDDSDRILPFACKHIRSFELRETLCRTDQFGETDVCLHPSIPVIFTLYVDNLFERAVRIDLENSLLPKTNLAQQSIGYIHFFGQDRSGGYFGWLNATLENADDNLSVWFAIDAVIDPTLYQYLKENTAQGRAFWMRKQIKVKYWCVDEQRSRLNAWDIDLANEYLRDELRREIWSQTIDQTLCVNKRIQFRSEEQNLVISYEDIPVALPPITKEETQRLMYFREEAIRVASNTPAIRDRIPDLWEGVTRGGKQKLLDNLQNEEGLCGTKVAYILEAACSYLDHDYANVLRCCLNAQSFGLGIQVAKWHNNWNVTQRMAEEVLDDIQEDVLQILCESAIHTGNAEVFCEVFAECIEAATEDDSFIEICDVLVEYAQYLLDNKGISSDGYDENMILTAVQDSYSEPLASLNELISTLACEDKDSLMRSKYEVAENSVIITSSNMPVSFATLKKQFKDNFRLETGELRSIDETNERMVAILDQLLSTDTNDVGEYRIPLLVRLAYDPEGSREAVKKYIIRLENVAREKRKSIQKDRRWRMFKAIDAYLETKQGLEIALQEAQGADEPKLLNYLAARR